MKHEQDVDVARRQFGMAEKQHGAQMRQAVGSLAFSAATTGIGHMQQVSGLKASLGADKYQALKAKGYSDDQLTKIAGGLQEQEMGLISKFPEKYSKGAYLDSLIGGDSVPRGAAFLERLHKGSSQEGEVPSPIEEIPEIGKELRATEEEDFKKLERKATEKAMGLKPSPEVTEEVELDYKSPYEEAIKATESVIKGTPYTEKKSRQTAAFKQYKKEKE